MIKVSEDEKHLYIKGSAVDVLAEVTNLYINVVLEVLKAIKDQKARNGFLRMVGDSFVVIIHSIEEFEGKEKGNGSENHQFRA